MDENREALRDIQKALTEHASTTVKILRYVERMDRRIDDLSHRHDGTNRRIDEGSRRITELKDDLELMFKMEILGNQQNLMTQLEQLLDQKLPDLVETAVRTALKDAR